MMTVKELKEAVADLDDALPVVFESVENGNPADTSYGLDRVITQHEFCILQSVD